MAPRQRSVRAPERYLRGKPPASRTAWRSVAVLVAMACSLLLLWPLVGENGLASYVRLHKQRDLLQQDVEKLRRQRQGLRASIDSLRTNPGVLERIAREQQDMRQPGETVYEILRQDEPSERSP